MVDFAHVRGARLRVVDAGRNPILPALRRSSRTPPRRTGHEARDGVHGMRLRVLPRPEGGRLHDRHDRRSYPPHPARDQSLRTGSGPFPADTSNGASRWRAPRSARRGRRPASRWICVAWSECIRTRPLRWSSSCTRLDVTGGTITLCHENDRVEWVERDLIPWEDLAFPSTTAALRDFLAARPLVGDGHASDGVVGRERRAKVERCGELADADARRPEPRRHQAVFSRAGTVRLRRSR